jgi:predicted peroxiredoxin
VETSGVTKRKFLILLTVGLNAPPVARSALMFASIAASMGLETVVYCVQEGVDVMVKAAAEKDAAAPGMPSLKQRLQEALKAGAKIQLCSTAVMNKKLQADDLIPEAEIVGGAMLIDLALESAGVLSF